MATKPYRTKVPIDKAIRLYESGMNVNQIGKELGFRGSTVWYAIKNLRPEFNMRAAHRRKNDIHMPESRVTDFSRDESELGWICVQPTITKLIRETVEGALNVMEPDVALNIETHFFNTMLHADSCEFKLNVGKDLWLNQQRWSRLIKEYVSREQLERFISQCIEIMSQKARHGATANMFFRDPDRYAKKHRWGGCLMSASFRGDNRKAGRATLTFFSRTTYIGYMGLLDAAIASVLAREITNNVPDFEDMGAGAISFRWYISSMQMHHFKSLPYIYSRPLLMEYLEEAALDDDSGEPDAPAWKYICRWYRKVVERWTQAYPKADNNQDRCTVMLAMEKYGPFKRIQRRWLESMGFSKKNLPKDLMIDDLNFDKAV